MAEQSANNEQRTYGRAGDAPNSLQRWLLAEAPLLATTGILGAVLTAVGVIFRIARGGQFPENPVVLVAVTWIIGTLVLACPLALTGWTKDRAERTVKYLPPFPWSRDQ